MKSLILSVLIVFTFYNLPFATADGKTRRREFVDLGYTLSNSTIFYPGTKPYVLTRDYEEWRGNGSYWYSSFSLCLGEHGGTHLDAPYHFFKDGWKVDEIPPSHLIDISATVVNVEEKVNNFKGDGLDPPGGDYKLSVADLMDHEKEFGRIPSQSLVLMYTGWSRFWPDRTKYLGYVEQGNSFTLRFPSMSLEAMKWMSEERQIIGIGLDAPSLDGADMSNACHVYGASRSIFNLKNVANLHILVGKEKTTGLRAFVMPVKIVGGSGAPVRILAEVH